MSDEVAIALHDILKEYGLSVCDTPRMCEVLLAQHCQKFPMELEALKAALSHGVVRDMIIDPKRDQRDLDRMAKKLVEESGLSPAAANWSVNIWLRVLCEVLLVTPTKKEMRWNNLRVGGEIEKQATRPMRSAMIWMVIVGLVGGLAGGAAGATVAYGLNHTNEQAVRIREAVEKHEKKGIHLGPWEFTLYMGVLGGLGGFAGSAAGFMLGAGSDSSRSKGIGAMIGALWSFDGAIAGMVFGGMPGCLFGTMITSLIITFIATKLGIVVICLLLKQLAWLAIDHF